MTRRAPQKPAKGRRKVAKGHGGHRAGAGRKPKPRRIHDYEALGDAPADELDAITWSYKALAVSMRQVMRDTKITDAQRRAEIRTISRAMNATIPKARLRKAELALQSASAAIEAKVDPQVVAVPDVDRDTKPQKPRPPKRKAPEPALQPVPEKETNHG